MDSDFIVDRIGLVHAVELMERGYAGTTSSELPASLPEVGLGSLAALDRLAPSVLGGAAKLGGTLACAQTDPPTPWVAWAATLWNASLNQNLLHRATSPVARAIEERVICWLAPFFGMAGGHMVPGATLANLTALWAARESAGITEVIASDSAHLSVSKAAHLLGLRFTALASSTTGTLVEDTLPEALGRAALVLTAGTTSTGAIDPLVLAGRAAWTHVDAAWAGPLRLTSYSGLLAGIENADSISVSAHKLLFQPKESALVLFRDSARAHSAISFGASYLDTPNVGLLGSHAATAVPLLATLLAWGREGTVVRIEGCIRFATQLAHFIQAHPGLELFGPPQTGIVVWRALDHSAFAHIRQLLPTSLVSTTIIAGETWFRCVAANPNVDFDAVATAIQGALG